MIIKNDPKGQLIRQLSSFYHLQNNEEIIINEVYPSVIKKMHICFRSIKNKYYHENGQEMFNALHVAQWTMFLYLMSRETSKYKGCELDDKIYGLSKIVSSADIFYGVEMPEIWFFDHPHGSVLGRAKYSNYFSFSQGCTVGNNRGMFPEFGEHVSMLSNSKVLGNCKIGDHVVFAANSYIIDQDIPAYSIVFGMAPKTTIKNITQEKFEEITGSMFISREGWKNE